LDGVAAIGDESGDVVAVALIVVATCNDAMVDIVTAHTVAHARVAVLLLLLLPPLLVMFLLLLLLLLPVLITCSCHCSVRC